MGYWGYEPWENDTGADWLDDVPKDASVEVVRSFVMDGLGSGQLSIVRAAALYVQLSDRLWPATRQDFDSAIEALNAIGAEYSKDPITFRGDPARDPILHNIELQIIHLRRLRDRRGGQSPVRTRSPSSPVRSVGSTTDRCSCGGDVIVIRDAPGPGEAATVCTKCARLGY